jgi:hypothetical protein
MYQSGMPFELPREGVERTGEIEISKLQRYLGKYHSEEKDLDFNVKISNQRLAVDVPGEMVYELLPPNDEGKWVFRPTDRVAVSFHESDDGEVTSMKLFRDGAQRLELLRMAGPEQASLPTLEEVLALRKSVTDTKAGAFRVTGRLRFVHAGVEGRATYASDGSRRYRSDADFGEFGWIHEVVTEEQGWIDSNIQPFQKLEGKYLTQAMVAQALISPQDWRRLFDTVTVTGVESLDGRKTYVLDLRAGELPTITASVDAETGDLLRYEISLLDPKLGIAVPTVIRQEDYREVKGIRVAFRIISRNEFSGEAIFEVEKIETSIQLDDQLFTPPTGN